jgi:hypothetical protein
MDLNISLRNSVKKCAEKTVNSEKGNALPKVQLRDNIRPGKLGHHSQLTSPTNVGAECSRNVADPSKNMSQPALEAALKWTGK